MPSKQIGTILSVIEVQDVTLAKIKAEDIVVRVLTSVKTLNDSHATYVVALAELKSSYNVYAASLAELKTVNISPEILEGVKALNEAHVSYAKALADLQFLAAKPAPPALEKVDLSLLFTKLDKYTTYLTEIKSAVTILAPAPEKVNLSPLSTKLEEHSTYLIDIKSAVNTPTLVPEKVDLSTLETLVNNTAELKILSIVEALGKEDMEILGEVKSIKTLIKEDKKD
ncbi:uncharacterized protein K444DRAFT_636066 [Hyaloscypha bicolor E]|uniref:Uncharacterized protein n=1 Tax=Hyaloscypha bicolor E TaxID=1095630 RepID=A0A2J6SR51_9HELO|nr:uncharacterized protein K444DRAFT_636066 [Hyaloscypha bicolor E]PMD53173.1 hypothetical protein K444DRAFT_636066 [Hyaloscypha bicolor E]